MKLYIFNPDTDLALADNRESYMPPAIIRSMAEDLALLPMWYAEPGSAVLAASAYNSEYMKQMKSKFLLPVTLLTVPELSEHPDVRLMPWGWNPALRYRLAKAGVPDVCLPSGEQMTVYRQLSGRNHHVHLLDTFKDWSLCCGEARTLTTLQACRQLAQEYPYCVFKSPWSGSGKGLCWCYGNYGDSVEKWCSRVLKEQGFLVGSPIYNKVLDFAMEFYSDGKGCVAFVGYSLFETNRKGAYQGNTLADDETIEQILTASYLPKNLLADVREHLCRQLALCYGSSYTGYVGVDMMVCTGESAIDYRLYPCVEVNLRMNMGVLSSLFSQRYLAFGATASFQVKYYPDNDSLRRECASLAASHPLVVGNGRMKSGFLPLVPVTPRSRYVAFVLG